MSDGAGINPAISRRSFILYTAGTAGAAALGERIQRVERGETALGPSELDAAVLAPPFCVILRRPEDQCLLTFGFWNMQPVFGSPTGAAAGPPTFEAIDADVPSYMTVTLGMFGEYIGASTTGFDSPAPQNIIEMSFPIVQPNLDSGKNSQQLDATGENNSIRPTSTPALDAPAVPAFPAGNSTIAFVIPDSMLGPDADDPLLLTTESLLAWEGLRLSVTAAALPPLTATSQAPTGFRLNDIVPPTKTQTGIEMPYGLILSPPDLASFDVGYDGFRPNTVFINSPTPVTAGKWTEVWHTRMGVQYAIFHETPITTGTHAGQNDRSDKTRQSQSQDRARPDIAHGYNQIVIDETNRALMTARAVWCTDSVFEQTLRADQPDEPPGDVPDHPSIKHPSLRFSDRYDIVRLTSDFTETPIGPFKRQANGTPEFIPTPVTIDRLMLSSLGGWLACNGHWDLPHAAVKEINRNKDEETYNSSLLSWRHRAAQGRDSYVRVVRKGYLFPWGHLASLITITERQIDDYPYSKSDHVPGAYMRQKTFIVVANPIKSYGFSGDFAPWKGCGIPFTSVEAVTLVTPPIQEKNPWTNKQNGNVELCFEPQLADGSPFLFHMRGTDWAGKPIDFHSPVLWVDDTAAYGDGTNAAIVNKAIDNWNSPRPVIDLHGQRVSVAAPANIDLPGDTEIVISDFQLGADHPGSGNSQDWINNSQPAFYPAMHQVTVTHPELGTAAGQTVPSSQFQYSLDYYLKNGGFNGSNNTGKIFLEAISLSGASALVFKSDHSGGSFTPNLSISAISRAIGPVSATNASDLKTAASGTFDPKQAFAESGLAAAKMLGGLSLGSIVANAAFSEGAPNSDTMTVTTNSYTDRVVTTVDWHPTITNYPSSGLVQNIFTPTGQDSSDDSMDLHCVNITGLNGQVPNTATVVGQIRDFTLNFYGDGTNDNPLYFIQVPFDSLTFRSQTGKKTDIQVQVNSDGISFEGPLGFVQDLADYLNFDGSGITITTAGPAIEADLTLAIPNITVGLFSLNNIAFNAGVSIPYNGDPVAFMFGFCSPENPFALDILIFSGGGYVTLTVGPNGLQELSIGFDFGFGYSIDIGIASGQVSLTGGITYTSQELSGGGQNVTFTAYVQAGGGLSALGVISISVSLYLGLTYVDDTQTGASSLTGTATLTISVHILFFGFSVGISMSETFAGSSGNGGNAVHAGNEARRRALAAKPAHASPDDAPPIATAPESPGPYAQNTFGESLSSDDWDDYCAAFATVSAA